MAIDLKEVRDIAIVIIALAFGFSLKYTDVLTYSNWYGAFTLMLVLVAISIAVHEFAHKLVAGKFSAEVKPKVWYVGIAIMLILLMITDKFVFAAIWAVSISSVRLLRPSRSWPHLGPRERAVIAASGLLANLALAILAKMLVPTLGDIATKLMMINLTLAIFNLVPFFTLLPVMMTQIAAQKPINAPYVEGEFIFFGAKTGWIFLFVFSVILAIGLWFFSATVSLLLAFLMALLLFVAWHYFFEPEHPSIMGGKSTSPSFRKYK